MSPMLNCDTRQRVEGSTRIAKTLRAAILHRKTTRLLMAAFEHTPSALKGLLVELNRPVRVSQLAEAVAPGATYPPLVGLARVIAVAASAALDELEINEALALEQLESNRTAALERITPSDPDAALPPLLDAALAEVQVHAEALSASIRTSAQRKRVALQAHAVAADAALEEALSVASDISDLTGSSSSKDEIRVLEARLAAARLRTEALPDALPQGAFLKLTESSAPALRAVELAITRADGTSVLRAAAESALGILLQHRAHVHSAACDHKAGPVLQAAKEGRVPALRALLESGLSSEEMDSVRRQGALAAAHVRAPSALHCYFTSLRPSPYFAPAAPVRLHGALVGGPQRPPGGGARPRVRRGRPFRPRPREHRSQRARSSPQQPAPCSATAACPSAPLQVAGRPLPAAGGGGG